MSASAWTRGNSDALKKKPVLLRRLEVSGISVVNGSTAFAYEISKRDQIKLFEREGLRHPRTRAVRTLEELVTSAAGLSFPILVKPNTGGSGAGIESFDSLPDLAVAVRNRTIELGPDGTGLIQERLPVRGDSIVRLEILDGELLYAIRLRLQPDSFNLRPADYCRREGSTVDTSDLVEHINPPVELVATAIGALTAAGADLGSVEYLVSDHDGEAYFYDLNVNSNYVADAVQVVGFDPFVRLVDYLDSRRVMAVSV
jgi:D-alanine-D-alanine ligase-like ATP-grasp enzyme